MLDFVTHDVVRPAMPAVHLAGHFTLNYGELAELIGEYQPEFAVPAQGFQRDNSQPAGEICIDTALLLATTGWAGRAETAER